MHKYHAKKIEEDGFLFDSKRERNRYIELKLLQKEKKISDLQLQPSFELQPSFKKGGKTYRAIRYIADFMYTDINGNTIVEDVKGYKTDVYRLKQKMFEYKFPEYTIIEV